MDFPPKKNPNCHLKIIFPRKDIPKPESVVKKNGVQFKI